MSTPLATIEINGREFAVWRSAASDRYDPDYTGKLGHVCEEANEIGWVGRTARLPDLKGGWFNAPVVGLPVAKAEGGGE